MKLLLKFALLFVFLSFVSCSSVSYNNDYDPSADFASYKTYKWYEGNPIEGDALVQYPLVQRRLASSVEKTLASKGFVKIVQGDADFIVILHAALSEKTQLNTTSTGGYGGYGGYGRYGWGGTGGMSTTQVVTYDEATLAIDIVDSGREELVWRGTATGVVDGSQKDQEEEQANTDETINLILENFPPKTK